MDWAGRHLISIGGVGIIVAVLGILVFILREAYPLFQSPRVQEAGRIRLDGEDIVLEVGVDPYREIAYAVRGTGVDFLRLDTGDLLFREQPAELQGRRITSAYRSPRDGYLGLGLDDGQVLIARVDFNLDYSTGERQITPAFAVEGSLVLDQRGDAITHLVVRYSDDGRSAVAGITAAGRLLVAVREQQQGLLGPGRLEEAIYELDPGTGTRPTAVAVDGMVRQVLAGTDRGEIREWELGEVDDEPRPAGSVPAAEDGAAISALSFVLGDVSLVVGDASGRVSTWFKVRDGQRDYRQIHVLQPHGAPVTRMAASERDKQFLTGDESGAVALHHMTSEQTFFYLETGPESVAALALAPKADGILTLGRDRTLRSYDLHNPHPDVTLGVLFGKVWYESYREPGYTWQSSAATDDFEPKLSLVPLVFGTAKGTLYAMFLALPLAILAAIYTSEFASPHIRSLVKPVVEVMASLPSVILGFLAGLWLAPLLERDMAGVLLLFPLVPAFVVATAWVWQFLPERVRMRVARGGEIYLLAALTLVAGVLALYLGPPFERLVFGGSFQQWLAQSSDLHYDQRNCLVVGVAMGFAVIPLIFTICEDALSSVPSGLRAGSLALGATRWQTAVRVVLPMAVPGMFSAAMIGFGRAVGETMIVLMATGNTPIMDWSIFNGMRAISANIAVELPEAPHHSSLYRILFLSGLLLFAVTFAVNTVAEIVRQHLREKFSRL